MAATLADQYTASQDAGFQGKIRIALVHVALTIASDPTQPAEHLALASQVTSRLDWYVAQSSIALASQGLDDATDDAALIAAVQATVAAAAALRIAGNTGV